MRHRERFFLTFLLILFLSLLLFFIGRTWWFGGVRGVFESAVKPFQKTASSIFRFPSLFSNSETEKLREENVHLHKKIVDQKKLEQEILALKDQFQTEYPKSDILSPVSVIGMPRFIPNVSPPTMLIIDRGEKDGIKVGQAVVLKDSVVGKITKVSRAISKVTLVTDPSSSFTAMTASGTLGVVNGLNGGNIIFTNVLSSENLSVGEAVVTKGDVHEDGIGYPPNLIVGKIASIDKTQSNLFQSAQVKSLVNFQNITTVFVVTSYKE